MIVAFIGNDGSGKTTISTHICNVLLSKGLKVYYKPEFEYFLVGYLLKIFGKYRENLLRSFVLITTGQKRKIIFRMWPYIVWLDFLFFWLFLRIFKKETIVIFDRYIYDFLISWEYLGYINSLLGLIYLAFPTPDISFVCKVSPRVAFARKPHYNLNFYTIQTKRYATLARHLGIKTVDTSKPLEETLKQVTEEVLASVLTK